MLSQVVFRRAAVATDGDGVLSRSCNVDSNLGRPCLRYLPREIAVDVDETDVVDRAHDENERHHDAAHQQLRRPIHYGVKRRQPLSPHDASSLTTVLEQHDALSQNGYGLEIIMLLTTITTMMTMMSVVGNDDDDD